MLNDAGLPVTEQQWAQQAPTLYLILTRAAVVPPLYSTRQLQRQQETG